jgi:DNA-directed RNA polymerase subunit RPC12/RpoP
MSKQCAICGKTRDLFALELGPDETDAGEAYTRYVCGSCWEVIAAISRRAQAAQVDAPPSKPAGQEAQP